MGDEQENEESNLEVLPLELYNVDNDWDCEQIKI